MAVDVSLNTISSGYNRTKIEDNFNSIKTALQDALSRSGDTPNSMSADIDLNGNDLLNVGSINQGNNVFVDAGTVAITYNFDSTTTMADPGSGDLRFNNATIASVTAIAIDDLDKNGDDRSAYILTWDDSSDTNKGTLIINDTTSSAWAIFTVTGLTDNSGWTEFAVTHVDSSGTFSNDDSLFLNFSRTGDAGDVVGAASSTDEAFARFDGVGGVNLQNSQTTEDDSGNVSIAGSLTIGTDLAITEGGTGASTASGARTNLGALTSDISSLTATTLASGDLVAVADIDDSNNPKKVTAQDIADLTPSISAASVAEMETGTSTSVYSSPGRQQRHKGHPKAWAAITTSGTADDSYNVASIDDDGVGDFGINFTTAFSAATFAAVTAVQVGASNIEADLQVDGRTTTSVEVLMKNGSTISETSIDKGFVACLGDQ